MYVKQLINCINKNYMTTRNFEFQKIFMRINVTRELYYLAQYNMIENYHLDKENRLDFFNEENYNKLLLEETECLNFYLITWNIDSLTKLHKHKNECLFKVLYGNLEETTVSNSPDDDILKIAEIHKEDDIKYVKKGQYHQIRNISEEYALSFHIYNKNNN